MTQTHAPLEWETPLFHQAIAQFQQAVPYADVSDAIVQRLSLPERSVIVSVPIKLDDGRRTVFPGYRVQHSSVLGPTKGGIRYDEHVSLGECAALSMWMTWKCALLRLPYGGAKGGIRCDPRALSLRELQAVTRRFTAELLPFIGPQEDIPAPDMATDEQTMAWMMDTYSMQVGHAVPEIVTGKPISIGGSVFRAEATGAGVVMVIERACRRLDWNLAGLTCAVQGFGKVGAVAANELHERGAIVTAVSDVSGGLHNESGLDIPSLYETTLEHGHATLAEHEGEHLTNEELLELPCDILVLAALEEQVTGENAPRVKARMIAEGANGPTTLGGRRDLRRARCPGAPGHPHERRRRDRLVLRVGAGSRPAVLGPRRHPQPARGQDGRRIRPGLGARRDAEPDPAPGRARHRDPGGGGCVERSRALPVTLVRDGMLSDPAVLAADATAQEAAEHLMRPDVRVVLVVDGGGTLVGVVTPDSLVEHVVAAGLDPQATPVSAAAREPLLVLDADAPLDDGYRLLEEAEVERAPVVEQGRLVGVLSRSVVQRRLAEDEPPPDDDS